MDAVPHLFQPAVELHGVPLFNSVDLRQRHQLQRQDEIWEDDTEAFLDGLKLAPGMRVLEYGCGLGFDLARLARRVAPHGEVVAVEATPGLAEESKALVKRAGLKRVRVVLGDPGLEPVPDGPYDLVFSSWKIGTIQAPASAAVLRRLLTQFRALLSPTGRVAFWEYHLEGIRMLPYDAALHEQIQTLLGTPSRASHWLPAEPMSTGFLFERAWPRQKAEAPGSVVYRWVEEALKQQAQQLIAQKLLEEPQWQNFQREWEGRRIDPRTLLFSPQIMGMVGRAIDPTFGDPRA